MGQHFVRQVLACGWVRLPAAGAQPIMMLFRHAAQVSRTLRHGKRTGKQRRKQQAVSLRCAANLLEQE